VIKAIRRFVANCIVWLIMIPSALVLDILDSWVEGVAVIADWIYGES
jgi:hypothetical protein